MTRRMKWNKNWLHIFFFIRSMNLCWYQGVTTQTDKPTQQRQKVHRLRMHRMHGSHRNRTHWTFCVFSLFYWCPGCMQRMHPKQKMTRSMRFKCTNLFGKQRVCVWHVFESERKRVCHKLRVSVELMYPAEGKMARNSILSNELRMKKTEDF